jgi:hypothetical protein
MLSLPLCCIRATAEPLPRPFPPFPHRACPAPLHFCACPEPLHFHARGVALLKL